VTTRDALARALAGRLAELFEDDAGHIDLDADVFAPHGALLGQRRLDSLDLVAIGVTIEEELGIRLHQHDLALASTLRLLAGLLLHRANDVAVRNFVTRWLPDPAPEEAPPWP
jgi:acyl carrier protein